MGGYFGISEYTFAVETEIYEDMISWLSKYDIPFEGSVEYFLPGMKFRMVTVKLRTAPELIIKDIGYQMRRIRERKMWEKNHRG